MFARVWLIPLGLVACGKRDEQSRAVSAADTPGAAIKNNTSTAPPTAGAIPPGHDAPIEGGGGASDGQHIKGGGDGIGFTQGSRRVAMAATVRTGQPSIEGSLDKETVRRYIRRSFPALRTCYEQRLVAREGLTGTLTASFVIQPDGMVRDAKASGVDTEVESCFSKVIAGIQFPNPKVREDVRVSYPFMLRPTDD